MNVDFKILKEKLLELNYKTYQDYVYPFELDALVISEFIHVDDLVNITKDINYIFPKLNFILFAQDPGGNLFLYEKGKVYYYDHEEHGENPEYMPEVIEESLESFFNKLITEEEFESTLN